MLFFLYRNDPDLIILNDAEHPDHAARPDIQCKYHLLRLYLWFFHLSFCHAALLRNMSACRYEGALYQDASKFLISIYYSKIPFQCKYISKGIPLPMSINGISISTQAENKYAAAK